MVPTRADRCTYVLYAKAERSSACLSMPSTRNDVANTLDTVDKAVDYLLDPVSGNNAKNRKPVGIICLHVDDLFMVGGPEFDKRVLERLRKDFNVGSEDRNDVVFVGQRIRWVKTVSYTHLTLPTICSV